MTTPAKAPNRRPDPESWAVFARVRASVRHGDGPAFREMVRTTPHAADKDVVDLCSTGLIRVLTGTTSVNALREVTSEQVELAANVLHTRFAPLMVGVASALAPTHTAHLIDVALNRADAYEWVMKLDILIYFRFFVAGHLFGPLSPN